MASSYAEEPPHDRAFAQTNATPNAGDFGKDFFARPETYGKNFRGNRPTAFESSLDGTVPLPSSWFSALTKKSKIKSDPEKFASHDSFVPPVEKSDADFDDSSAYVAIDPFVPSVAQRVADYSSHLPTKQSQVRPTIDPSQSVPTEAHGVTSVPTSSYIIVFFLDTLPRQIYLYFLLTLPSLYFSRVARIFEEAQLSMPDIKKMAISSTNDYQDHFPSATRMLGPRKTPTYSVPSPFDSQVVARFKSSWEQFVDSLMKEWKTLNLVSVLLLSAILTTLQIDGAVTDPYTRYFAFLALVCSLMSLLYGCIYIIRFNTMRKTHKAAEWAEEGQKTRTFIWWNVWVLLAMPAIWLSWSIIFYLTCIMTFLWRTGTTSDAVLQMTPTTALGPRLSVTFTFILGLVYLCLIIREFRRYGDAMDKAWRKRVIEWRGTQRNTFGIPPDPWPPIVGPKKSDDSAKFIPPPPGWLPRNPPDTFHGPPSQGMRPFIPFSQNRPIDDPETSDYPQSFPPQMLPIVDPETSVYSNRYIPPLPAWLPENPPDTLHGPTSQGMRPFIPFSQNRPMDDPETSDYPAQPFPPSNTSGIPHGRMSPIVEPERSVYSARYSPPAPQESPDTLHGPSFQGRRSSIPFSQDRPTVDETADYPAQSFPPASPDQLPQNPLEVPFEAVKIIDLHAEAHISYDRSWVLEIRDIGHITWNRFISDVCRAWDGPCPRFLKDSESSSRTVDAAPQDVVARLIALWNVEFFLHRGTQAVLCEEQINEEPTSLSYAVYLIDLEPSSDKPSAEVQGEQLAHRFGKIPSGVKGINLYDPVPYHGDIQHPTSRPLHVHLPPSRQPDWTSSPWETHAPEGPGEDERSPDDGDIHGERVFSLYAQPDMGITRHETTISTEALEDNGLLMLPEQEISQGERQLNQDAEEYDLNNLAERPNDWRSDYRWWRTFTLQQQRPTTSVEEFEDPIGRTVCTTLTYFSRDPSIVYDLRFFPNKKTLSFPFLRHVYIPDYFFQPATNPPVERMRLWHPLLPWYIDVRQSQPKGVTVEDVIMQVFWKLQPQIIAMHYYNKELDHNTRQRIGRAFERRTQGNDEERTKGIKKVDYLEDQVVFIGLVRTDNGLWEMKTRQL